LRDTLAVEQFIARRGVAGDWPEDLPDWQRREGGRLILFEGLFPWEKARALRVLDLAAVAQWESLDLLDPKLDTTQIVLEMIRNARVTSGTTGRISPTNAIDLVWRLAAATPVLKLYDLPHPYALLESHVLRETARRELIESLRTPAKPAPAISQ